MFRSSARLFILLAILFISSNANAQWKKTNLYTASSVGISKIYSNNGIIFISANSTTASGLHRSIDGGLTWDLANNGLPQSNGNTNVTSKVLSVDNKNFYCAAYDIANQVFLSTNTGTNWIKISDSNIIGSVHDIRIDKSGNLIVCSLNGVFKTTDQGKTWINLNFNNVSTNRYVFQIEIGPNNNIYAIGSYDYYAVSKGTIYADSLLKYDNGSGRWSKIKSMPSGSYIRQFQINSLGNIILLDSVYNIYRSTDDGNSWINLINHSTGILYGYIQINTNDDIFTTSDNSSGWNIIQSTDNGATWKTIYYNIYGVDGAFVTEDNHLFANAYYGGTYMSSDNGKTWEQFNFLYAPITSVYAGNNNKLFAGASDGLYFSTDEGDTWTKTITTYNYSIKTISGNTNNRLIVDFGDYSLDDGLTWNIYIPPYSGNGSYLSAATVLPNNTLLICLETNSTDQTIGSIKRSTDDGNTWTNANGFNGSNIKMYAVATNNEVYSLDSWSGRPGMGYSGYDVFKSTDNGANWNSVLNKGNSPYGNNPSEFLVSVSCHPNGDVFASSNLGIYRSWK